ncbi:ABC transporter permease, partial [Kocuria sp. CPCC 205236]
GLAAGLLFRSESAVGAASGMLVVLSFFGNLFVPLSGDMLEIARFTPLYGLAGLTRYPMIEGAVVSMSGAPTHSDPLWALMLNVVVWTLIFAALVLLAVRRTTARR